MAAAVVAGATRRRWRQRTFVDALEGGAHERREAFVVLNVERSAREDELPHHLGRPRGVVGLAGLHERRDAAAVHEVDLGARVDEQTQAADLLAGDRLEDRNTRRVPLGVGRAVDDRLALLEQARDLALVAELDGDEQVGEGAEAGAGRRVVLLLFVLRRGHGEAVLSLATPLAPCRSSKLAPERALAAEPKQRKDRQTREARWLGISVSPRGPS